MYSPSVQECASESFIEEQPLLPLGAWLGFKLMVRPESHSWTLNPKTGRF